MPPHPTPPQPLIAPSSWEGGKPTQQEALFSWGGARLTPLFSRLGTSPPTHTPLLHSPPPPGMGPGGGHPVISLPRLILPPKPNKRAGEQASPLPACLPSLARSLPSPEQPQRRSSALGSRPPTPLSRSPAPTCRLLRSPSRLMGSRVHPFLPPPPQAAPPLLALSPPPLHLPHCPAPQRLLGSASPDLLSAGAGAKALYTAPAAHASAQLPALPSRHPLSSSFPGCEFSRAHVGTTPAGGIMPPPRPPTRTDFSNARARNLPFRTGEKKRI